nr:response regulator [Nitrospirota bacterium]
MTADECVPDVQRDPTTTRRSLQAGRDRGCVLVADDEEPIREFVVELLQAEGYHCDSVGTAQEAVKALATDAYDLLITDVRMPGNDTLAFLSPGRTTGPTVPVIVITGHPTVETAMEAVRFSVVDYLIKPVSSEALCKSVDLAIGKGRALRALRKVREEMRLWGEAMNILEQSLAASDGSGTGAKGAGPTERVLDQTMTLFRQIVTSLKVTLEATTSERFGQRNMDLCAAVGCTKLAVYEEALHQSVQVLMATKNSFKSKELGELRKMLAGVLRQETGRQP